MRLYCRININTMCAISVDVFTMRWMFWWLWILSRKKRRRSTGLGFQHHLWPNVADLRRKKLSAKNEFVKKPNNFKNWLFRFFSLVFYNFLYLFNSWLLTNHLCNEIESANVLKDVLQILQFYTCHISLSVPAKRQWLNAQLLPTSNFMSLYSPNWYLFIDLNIGLTLTILLKSTTILRCWNV